MANYIPVSSKLVLKGTSEELFSIKSLYPKKSATITRLAPTDGEFDSFDIKVSQTNISTALSLQFANVFSNQTDFNSLVYTSDICLFSAKNVADPNSIIKTVYWGCGIRIVYRVWDIKEDFKISFSTIGLAVQAGIAKSDCQIVGIGLDYNAFSTILAQIQPFDILDSEKIEAIQRSVFVLNSSGTSGTTAGPIVKTSVPLGVELKSGFKGADRSVPQTVIFAVKCILDQINLKNALARNSTPAGGYDSFWIEKTYEEFVHAFSTAANPNLIVPTDADAANANAWISLVEPLT